jgi:hypothetical protein
VINKPEVKAYVLISAPYIHHSSCYAAEIKLAQVKNTDDTFLGGMYFEFYLEHQPA